VIWGGGEVVTGRVLDAALVGVLTEAPTDTLVEVVVAMFEVVEDVVVAGVVDVVATVLGAELVLVLGVVVEFMKWNGAVLVCELQ
jgi:hypothetical protein